MTEKDLRRKLTTVFSADVAGYSRLMCRDEDTTVITFRTYRDIISKFVEGHGGRVVDAIGDNLLAEFSCAKDAVACGWAIQEALYSRNMGLPLNKRMYFRIGINFGEVIEDDGRLYGTAVNIAARLESMANPGEICISLAVFERVQSLLSLHFEYLGTYDVKNICRKVEVYRICTAENADHRDSVAMDWLAYREPA